jgi:hypothetical protein
MNTQNLYGYRLSHEDGSQSKWVFINSLDGLLDINIKLRNGARYHFAEYHGDDFIDTWAYAHTFRLMRSHYSFDVESMSFKLLTLSEV